MSPLSRRQVLGLFGLGAAGLTLPTLRARADATPPKRLLILSSNHGTSLPHWAVNPKGLPDDATWSQDLSELSEHELSHILQPLHRHRARMNVIEGISMPSAELDLPGMRHEKGWIHAWTGGKVHFTADDLFATVPSLDQLVARQIRRPDRLSSLELSVAYGRPISHAGLHQTLPQSQDPHLTWSRLFGASQQGAAEVKAHTSVLDSVLQEFEDAYARVGLHKAQELSAHTELVRSLELRLAGMAELQCEVLDKASLATADGDYDDVFDAQAHLIATAFACDATRVATLALGDLPPDGFGWAELARDDVHTYVAHRYYEHPDAYEAMGDYNRVHAQQIARLLDLLESIPDGDGTLLDHTLVVWGNEMGDGWHGYETYPAVTFGGGWAMDTGRYLHLPWGSTDVPLLLPTRESRCGLPHQHFLVSIAQAMGLSVDTVGQDVLQLPTGRPLSLSGPVPGLLRA